MENPIFYDISYCFVEDLGLVGKKSNVKCIFRYRNWKEECN